MSMPSTRSLLTGALQRAAEVGAHDLPGAREVRVLAKEAGGAHDEGLHARLRELAEGAAVAGAVHLQDHRQALFLLDAPRLAHLVEHLGDERLAREARVHAHEGDLVQAVHVAFDHGKRGLGVDRHARAKARGADLVDQPERPAADDLGVRAEIRDDPALAQGPDGPGEGLEVLPRLRHHQVDVQRQRAHRRDGRGQVGREGDVGHEMPVHDVEVVQVGAGVEDLELTADVQKVHAHQRGIDDGFHAGILPLLFDGLGHEVVQGDGDDDERAHDDLLQRGVEHEHRHAVVDDADNQAAGHPRRGSCRCRRRSSCRR